MEATASEEGEVEAIESGATAILCATDTVSSARTTTQVAHGSSHWDMDSSMITRLPLEQHRPTSYRSSRAVPQPDLFSASCRPCGRSWSLPAVRSEQLTILVRSRCSVSDRCAASIASSAGISCGSATLEAEPVSVSHPLANFGQVRKEAVYGSSGGR